MRKRNLLVVTEEEWRDWRGHFASHNDERMSFGYCGRSSTAESEQYLLRKIDLPDDAEYRFQGAAGVSLKAENVIPRLTRARNYAALIDAHSHPFTRRPRPSFTDDEGAAKQLVVMRTFAPDTDLIRLVFGSDEEVWAEATTPGAINWQPLNEIIVLGPSARRIVRPVNAPRVTFPSTRMFDARTQTAIGSNATAAVRSLKVTVIGGGGVGSAVLAQLRGYVDEINIIDPDVVVAHNAPRLYHYADGDIGISKTRVHEREIRRAFPQVSINCFQGRFPEDQSIELFKRADMIFCCPDHNAVRYATAVAGARYMKPVIEVGCGGRRVNGEIAALGYHVRLQVPGFACLACNGLDLHDLEDPSTSDIKRRIGYLGDSEIIAGELMPLTTRAAADAVDLFFRYVAGYVQAVPRHLYFDALRWQVIDATEGYKPHPDCSICGDGHDELCGLGDSAITDHCLLPSPEGGDYVVA